MEAKNEAMTIGKNVLARTEGKMLWIGIDTGKDTGKVTEKGNLVVATVGAPVSVAGVRLSVTAFRPAS